MRRGCAAAAVALGVAIAPSFACGPVIGAPLSIAPVNACGPGELSCDRYATDDSAPKAQCKSDPQTRKARCDFGRPDFAYAIVVSVPDSSFYAPGRTFVLTNNDLVEKGGAPSDSKCSLSTAIPCKRLPPLVPLTSRYTTTRTTAMGLGVDVKEGTSIPIRATFVPLAPDADVEAFGAGIPLQDFVVASRSFAKADLGLSEAIALGSYLRIAYPEPPFDAFFPPVFRLVSISEPVGVADNIELGKEPGGVALDDPDGTTRQSQITRLEGLDGWRAWFADEPAFGGRRISTIKRLSGTTSTVTLHTIGASQAPSTALRANTEIVVAPPPGWLGVPRLESIIFNGDPAGFKTLTIPPLKTPVIVSGVVGQGEPTLIGAPSRLLFTSTAITTLSGDALPTLKYEAAVSTDASGRFQTVLPEGTYDVTVEPAEGTGLSKYRDTLSTALATAKTFRPPPRTVASGRAMLSDGRALPEAAVLVVPAEVTLVGRAVRPRPARTRSRADGTFTIEVDQGQYTLMVDPLPGTDFPRAVQARSFTGATADVGDVVVEPPLRLTFRLRDPSDFANPIIRANVAIYAKIPGRGPPAVEMGRATTDTSGYVEILLAPQAP